MRIHVIACAVLLATQGASAQYSVSGWSTACGPVSADTEPGLKLVAAFCDAVPVGTAVGAAAAGTKLWVKVDQVKADQLRSDRAEAEQLVLMCLKAWRELTGSVSPTVVLKWGDLRLAEGQTTPARGDQVTFLSLTTG